MTRHQWDYRGADPYAAKRRACKRCGLEGRTFGVGAGRIWDYTRDGQLGTRLADFPCDRVALAAWVITSDRSSGPWPSQAGDTMPGATRRAVSAALEAGKEFRVTNYTGEAVYLGKVYPDATVLAEGFTTEDGRPAVDPEVADLVQVLDGGEWRNLWDAIDPARGTG